MASRLPAAPPVLPGFQYVRPLGTGGFADVFLFEQDMPRRLVAVKVLLQNVVDEGLLRMFNAEADAMARLSSHPSILTIYQASISADGRPYLVMEYCPSSLTTRYRREEIPVTEVLQLGIKIGSALETAHRAGMLHRDIKPSNLLVTSFGSPVLSDFGISAAVTARSQEEVFAMSVPWSAPEIVNESISGSISAEVWSLGATVYTLLAGRSPFERPGRGQNSREQLKTRIKKAHFTPTGREDVPAPFETVLRKAMAKDPAARHSSAAELAYELQLVQYELGHAATPLEIAVDEWAEAPTVMFDDARSRGPVRSAVAHASRRPGATIRAQQHRQAPEASGLAQDSHTAEGLSTTKVVWIVAGAVVTTAAVVVGAIALLGGFS